MLPLEKNIYRIGQSNGLVLNYTELTDYRKYTEYIAFILW